MTRWNQRQRSCVYAMPRSRHWLRYECDPQDVFELMYACGRRIGKGQG